LQVLSSNTSVATAASQYAIGLGVAGEILARFHVRVVMAESDAEQIHGVCVWAAKVIPQRSVSARAESDDAKRGERVSGRTSADIGPAKLVRKGSKRRPRRRFASREAVHRQKSR